MFKKGSIVVVLVLIVLVAYYFYDQSNTYASPTGAVEKTEHTFPIHEIVLSTEEDLDPSISYTLYISEIDQPGDYYVFTMSKQKLSGWKVVDFMGGVHLSKSNANGSYSYSKYMELITGLIDDQVERVMVGERSAKIATLPNSDLRVWYQIGISEEDSENVRFLDENNEEIN